MVDPWLVAGAVLFLLGHAVILLFVYRLRGDGRTPLSADESDASGAVTCQECGVENDADYRYCRACAAELPGGVVPGTGEGGGDSRELQ
jgi:hypothetical protein